MHDTNDENSPSTSSSQARMHDANDENSPSTSRLYIYIFFVC